MKQKILKFIALSVIFIFQAVSFMNCSGSTANTNQTATNLPGVTVPLNFGSTAANVMPVTVGNCGVNGYINEPCVSVTVCQHGTSNCTTIPNILLDTGSYGLRVFGSALGTTVLTPVTTGVGSNPVVECASFGSGSTWGPVQRADVGLGGEPKVYVPIQVINSAFTVPTVMGSPACNTLMLDPASAGFNGILGVGLLLYDCGTACVTPIVSGVYFKCPTPTTCVDTVLPLTSQIINPVAALPVDNNGVILSFASVSLSGVASANGTMTIGIGTSSNNIPPSLNVFAADQYANITTVYDGTSNTQSFIDSGSNGLYFPDSKIIKCTVETGFFCPTSPLTLRATIQSQTTSVTSSVPFYVGNTHEITAGFTGANGVLNNLGGNGNLQQFDWGFPFHLGRTIYSGIETKSSSLGSGPYWAF